MNPALERASVGCLTIDDFTPGKNASSGPLLLQELPGVAVLPFERPSNGDLWDGLRVVLHDLRGRYAVACLMARGTGCAAALALAEQLPVDRLVLIDPILSPSGPVLTKGKSETPEDARLRRQVRRLSAFARRNLPLCVSDALVVEIHRPGSAQALRRAGLSAHCRVSRLQYQDENVDKLYTIREIAVKEAISCFLRAGELPKPLAENPEMCIIVG